MVTDSRAFLCLSNSYTNLALQGLLLGTGSRDLLANEQANDTDGDDEDDTEDDDNTGFLLGPVLTLGDLGEGLTGDQGVVDGRHLVVCVGEGAYESIVSYGSAELCT